jgi:hypothetical protein
MHRAVVTSINQNKAKMKQVSNALNAMRVAVPQSFRKSVSNTKSLALLIMLGAFFVSGCSKDEVIKSEQEAPVTKSVNADGNVLLMYEGLDKMTMWELQQARAATAKYRHLDKALKDGYIDIDVVIPGMGYHFMNPDLVDGTFDIRKPEILVYNIDEDGVYQLVAVEYAIPLALSPMAPEGFTGDGDVWSANTEVELWLLHAWVWKYNPLGVFSPFNPDVILL